MQLLASVNAEIGRHVAVVQQFFFKLLQLLFLFYGPSYDVLFLNRPTVLDECQKKSLLFRIFWYKVSHNLERSVSAGVDSSEVH